MLPTANITDDVSGVDLEGSSYLAMYGEHRAQKSLLQLPKWLQDYFSWHRSQTETSSIESKYLVVTCLERDKCGGFSDRLRPLPFWLLLASKVDRVLCIYWARPFALDSLLQPLPSGIDWRCPKDFIDVVNHELPSRWQRSYKHHIIYKESNNLSPGGVAKSFIEAILPIPDKFTSVSMKDQDFGKIVNLNMVFNSYSYNERLPIVNAWMHVPLMEHIFRVMFEPIEPIAKSINATMTRLGLVENEFTSVHVRARYPTRKMMVILGDHQSVEYDKNDRKPAFEGRLKALLLDLAKNALECGILLKPEYKLFVSSDSVDLTNYVTSTPFAWQGTKPATYHVAGIDARDEIKHLEHSHHVSHVEFYPLIEDLLIMGGSACVSHGVGSFGAFAAGLAGNRCRAIHRKPTGKTEKCPNNRAENVVIEITNEYVMGDNLSDLGEGRLPPAEGTIFINV